MAHFIITIDGPAGSGKSTIARQLAQRLDATFLDTGAMYRTVTLDALESRIELDDENALMRMVDSHQYDFKAVDGVMRTSINGKDVTDLIREPALTSKVKHIASSPKIRSRLVEMQRHFASQYERVVTEGRDQGTVAFPSADFKFYLDADAKERAKRRLEDLRSAGRNDSLDEILSQIIARDASDVNRHAGPLAKARDAIIIDTTDFTIEQVLEKIMRVVHPNE